MSNYDDSPDICIKVVLVGNADSGKSSLTGVLTRNILDDGNGFARSFILQNKHEKVHGTTSTITQHNIVYDTDGKKKIFTLIDLAGQKDYLKTTITGITSLYVDFGLLIVDATNGITDNPNDMTVEHLKLLLCMDIPFMIIMTKYDRCIGDNYEKSKNSINTVIRKIRQSDQEYATIETSEQITLRNKLNNRRLLFFDRNPEYTSDLVDKYIKKRDIHDKVIPVLTISNKTGMNIDCLHNIIKNIRPLKLWLTKSLLTDMIFNIDHTFQVKGIGTVFSGKVKGTPITKDQILYCGPINGFFIPLKVKSLHNNNKTPVDILPNGETGCIAVHFMQQNIPTRSQLSKGIIITNNPNIIKYVSTKFKINVNILHHSTTIVTGYQPIIHCGAVRQSATFIIPQKSEKQSLSTGDNVCIFMEFMKYSVFIEPGMKFFFRDGTTKGVGEIIEGNPPDFPLSKKSQIMLDRL